MRALPVGMDFAVWFDDDAYGTGGHEWGMLTPWCAIIVSNFCWNIFRASIDNGIEIAWGRNPKAHETGGAYHLWQWRAVDRYSRHEWLFRRRLVKA